MRNPDQQPISEHIARNDQTSKISIPHIPAGWHLAIAGLTVGTYGILETIVNKTSIGQVPSVEAASVCRGQRSTYRVFIKATPFVDMASYVSEMGRKGIFDKGLDPWMEAPIVGQLVTAYADKEKKNRLASTTLTTTPAKIPGFQLTDTDKKIGFGLLVWEAACNWEMTLKNGKVIAAYRGFLVSSQDENNPVDFQTPEGAVLPYWFGREIKDPTDFLKLAESGSPLVHDLDKAKRELISKGKAQVPAKPEPKPEVKPVPKSDGPEPEVKPAASAPEQKPPEPVAKPAEPVAGPQELAPAPAAPAQPPEEEEKVEGVGGWVRNANFMGANLVFRPFGNFFDGLGDSVYNNSWPIVGGLAKFAGDRMSNFSILQFPVASALLYSLGLDRPVGRRPRTRVWNTLAFPVRYLRHSRSIAHGGPAIPHPWPI